MSKKKKTQQRKRPELGFIGLGLALLGLAIVAGFLSNSRQEGFGPALSLFWFYAGVAAFVLGIMYYAQFVAPVRGNFGWWEGVRLIFRSYRITTIQFFNRPERRGKAKKQTSVPSTPTSLQSLEAGFVDSHLVLPVVKGKAFIRVAGPGFVNLYKKEMVRQVIDLRTQLRSQPVHFNTRDGIPVKTSVTIVFQVKRADTGFPKEMLYPFDQEAVFQLNYLNTVDVGGKALPWHLQLTPRAAALISQELAQYDLNALIDYPPTAVAPTAQVMPRIQTLIQDEFDAKGIQVFAVKLGPLLLPEPVRQQAIDTWRAAWEGKIRMEEASSKAEVIRRMKQARARAQIKIIESIIQNLEAMRQENDADAANVIILRLISALEDVTYTDSPLSFVPHQVMTSLVTDTSARMRARLDDHFLLPGDDGAQEEDERP